MPRLPQRRLNPHVRGPATFDDAKRDGPHPASKADRLSQDFGLGLSLGPRFSVRSTSSALTFDQKEAAWLSPRAARLRRSLASFSDARPALESARPLRPSLGAALYSQNLQPRFTPSNGGCFFVTVHSWRPTSDSLVSTAPLSSLPPTSSRTLHSEANTLEGPAPESISQAEVTLALARPLLWPALSFSRADIQLTSREPSRAHQT